MESVDNAYENMVRFYFPRNTANETVLGDAFYEKVDARLRQLCSGLAKELSKEYSVPITTSVGPASW